MPPSRPSLPSAVLAAWRAAVAVVRFWATERRSVRQALIALGIYTGVGLAAGAVLGAMEGIIADLPGLLTLIPAAISLRGAVFGTLAARLGTGMLTGQFELSRRRSSFTSQNIEAAVLLTMATAVLAALVAYAVAGAFGLETVGLLDLVTVSVLGSVVSAVLVFGVVIALALNAERRNWDMDAIGAPIVTAAGDITTLPALALATLVLPLRPVSVSIGALSVLLALAAAGLGLRHPGSTVRGIVRQSLPVLGYMAVAGVLAGTVLETRVSALVGDPALLILIPPFIGLCGSLGGILSARLSSGLHLGLLAPRPVPDRAASLEGSVAMLLGVAVFPSIGVLTHLLAHATGLRSPGLLALVGVATLAGLVASLLLIGVAYYTATASYHFGFDPDNYGLPIVSATMDFLGILCLVGSIAAFGLSGPG